MAQVFAGKRQRVIAILREVKNKWERRTPLIPSDVAGLTKQGVRVLVQPSSMRIYKDIEFKSAGAELVEDVSPANTILGVKEFPKEQLLADKAYMIFSHTIKAQPYNMPFLDAALAKRVRLFDYETIRAPSVPGGGGGGRLVAFGKFAGYAGMIDCLRGLGERLLSLGYSSPFMGVSSSYMYPGLPEAKAAVAKAGAEIKEYGLPLEMAPMRFVFTGTGNVARGAQEIFELLPHKYVTAQELATLPPNPHVLYGCVVTAEDMVERRDSSQPFNKKEYYENPTLYRPVFHEKIAPHMNVLVNCMYWDTRFPRLISIPQMKALEQSYLANPRQRKFLALADITCDIGGSVEFLKRSSTIDNPFFMYDANSDEVRTQIEGPGVLVLGVDNLPAEFPRDASMHFSQALKQFALPLSEVDCSKPWKDAGSYLPPELVASCITADGALTPPYEYIARMRAAQAQASSVQGKSGSAVGASKMSGSLGAKLKSVDLLLEGHLFDTGFINSSLDLFETYGQDFEVVQWVISPNRAARADNISRAVIHVTVESDDKLNQLESAIRTLAERVPAARAKLVRLQYDNVTNTYSGVIDERNRTTISFLAQGARKVAEEATSPPATAAAVSSDAAAPGHASGTSPSSSETLSTRMTPRPTLSKRKKILVLGSGFVAGPLVEYLHRKAENEITVASAVEAEAKRLIQPFQPQEGSGVESRVASVLLNVSDAARVRELVSSHDLVVSLLPATLHVDVARQCIELKRDMVTASYVSPAMHALHGSAQQAGISILNEMGLDPGLDHMACMQIIDHAHAEGAKVLSFKSLCGGLPAPEAATNPFAYKFSWSPLGMLLATQNNATYKEGGKLVELPSSKLLTSASSIDLTPAFRLESYANRDSLSYASLYGIDSEVESMIRGTIRYAGTALLLHGYAKLGLLDRTPLARGLPGDGSWAGLLQQLLGVSSAKELPAAIERKLQATGDFTDKRDIQRVVSSMQWLGMMSPEEKLVRSSSSAPVAAAAGSKVPSPMELLCALLAEKLTYAPGERDMVVMYHEFLLAHKDGRRTLKKSSLISYGGDDGATTPYASLVNTPGGGGRKGYSAMSRTVGLPAAIGAQMILDGRIARGQGVIIPTARSIYEPVLEEMAQKEGIAFVEEEREVRE